MIILNGKDVTLVKSIEDPTGLLFDLLHFELNDEALVQMRDAEYVDKAIIFGFVDNNKEYLFYIDSFNALTFEEGIPKVKLIIKDCATHEDILTVASVLELRFNYMEFIYGTTLVKLAKSLKGVDEILHVSSEDEW